MPRIGATQDALERREVGEVPQRIAGDVVAGMEEVPNLAAHGDDPGRIVLAHRVAGPADAGDEGALLAYGDVPAGLSGPGHHVGGRGRMIREPDVGERLPALRQARWRRQAGI